MRKSEKIQRIKKLLGCPITHTHHRGILLGCLSALWNDRKLSPSQNGTFGAAWDRYLDYEHEKRTGLKRKKTVSPMERKVRKRRREDVDPGQRVRDEQRLAEIKGGKRFESRR